MGFFKAELVSLWKARVQHLRPYYSSWKPKQTAKAVTSCEVWYLPVVMMSWFTVLSLFILFSLYLDGTLDLITAYHNFDMMMNLQGSTIVLLLVLAVTESEKQASSRRYTSKNCYDNCSMCSHPHIRNGCVVTRVSSRGVTVTMVVPPLKSKRRVRYIMIIHNDSEHSTVISDLILLAGDVETNPGPDYLNTENLGKVQNLLWKARTQWYNLGLELGINEETLKVIKRNYPDEDDCYREMLSKWLKTVKPTWEGVLVALTQPSVGCDHVAEKVRQKLGIPEQKPEDKETSLREIPHKDLASETVRSGSNIPSAQVRTESLTPSLIDGNQLGAPVKEDRNTLPDNKLSVPLDWPPELIVSDKSTEMTVSPSSVDGFFHEEVADSLDKHADQEKFLTDVTQYISYISHGIEKHLDPLVKSRCSGTMENFCMFPKDARIHEGDRVYFNDKKGIRHYGIACWAGRRAPMKRWRDDIMKIGIITDIAVFDHDFDDSEHGMNYLLLPPHGKARALIIPEAHVSVISGRIKQDAKNEACEVKKEEEEKKYCKHWSEAQAQIAALSIELQDKDAEMQVEMSKSSQLLSEAHAQIKELNTRLQDDINSEHTHYQLAAESWNIPRAEMQKISKRVIGHGAWGEVYSGTFQGERVAIKIAHRDLLHATTIDMLKREVMIMANIQHPNLVRFVGAVFDDAVEKGRDMPIIVSELMDMNLRSAYTKVNLSPSLISIFCDVAYALHYLHQHSQPIIHRDVSAPNVLLKSLPSGGYQAKVSDFGSANLVKQATTAGAGAIVYCAPEMFPNEDISDPPQPQTTKVDVFSYGIVMLEVIVKEMPTPSTRYTMLQQLKGKWTLMYELIVQCTKPLPCDRPAMADILNKLNRIPH